MDQLENYKDTMKWLSVPKNVLDLCFQLIKVKKACKIWFQRSDHCYFHSFFSKLSKFMSMEEKYESMGKNLKNVNSATYLQLQKWGHTRGGLRPDLIWCSLFYLKNSIFNEMSRRSHWARNMAHAPPFALYALPQPQSDFSYTYLEYIRKMHNVM